MRLKILSGIIVLFSLPLFISNAYSFDVESFNMTLTDVQKTEYVDYDILKLVFSLYNGDSQQTIFSGHSMLYLNDTNGDYWEYSNYLDLDGYSSSDCPYLEMSISSGTSSELQLCFLTSNEPNIGYSLILNDSRYFKDSQTKVFVLEYVPNWFKSTADAWCTDMITENDFLNSTEFYIVQGSISVLRTQSGIDTGTQIPAWVKDNTCLWSDNQISDYEFLDGIYWLIDNGKVQI